jgi:hypothetical protein
LIFKQERILPLTHLNLLPILMNTLIEQLHNCPKNIK